ncbi:hypothetical protein CHELA40_40177 [Chelatococcus asaccharovorans]|nr:hypothetical protein CHELA17_50017 [Chelatococcus asaccharovorans]CAH1690158.1 hypothetical protein CHELA40_40177 [Chelatococcus asaccharovorans]
MGSGLIAGLSSISLLASDTWVRRRLSPLRLAAVAVRAHQFRDAAFPGEDHGRLMLPTRISRVTYALRRAADLFNTRPQPRIER